MSTTNFTTSECIIIEALARTVLLANIQGAALARSPREHAVDLMIVQP
jgi:hypothetical protein